MKYPKLWDGPSPVGEALVRALQRTGEPFLRASTADSTTAGTMNGFQEVRGGKSVQFSSGGKVKQRGKEKLITVTAEWYNLPFIARGIAHTSDSNRRRQFLFNVESEDYRNGFTYPGEGGGGGSILFNGFRYASTIFESRFLRRRPYRTLGQIEILTLRPSIVFVTNYFRTGPRLDIVNIENKNPSGFLHWSADLGETDLGGAPCPEPVYSLLTWGVDDDGAVYRFPRDLLPNNIARRYEPTLTAVVGPNRFYALIISSWMYTTNHTDDVSERARLFYTTTGGRTWTVRDITTLLLDKSLNRGHLEPEMRYAKFSDPPDAPNGGVWETPPSPDFWQMATVRRDRDAGLPEDGSTTLKRLINVRETFEGSGVYTYGVGSTFVYPHRASDQNDIILNRMYVTENFTGVDNNEALFSTLHSNGVASENVGALYKFTPSGAVKLWDSQSENVFSYIQAMVYLGSGAVLAKRTFGFATTNADVKFELSLDNGQTFVEVPATGLPPLRKNRFFGSFTLVKEYLGKDKQGIVLIPAFDEGEMGYFVYESRDAGRTWEKRACLAKTEQFYRVDAMLVGDGGGNFTSVQYFGTNAKPSLWNAAIEDMRVKY